MKFLFVLIDVHAKNLFLIFDTQHEKHVISMQVTIFFINLFLMCFYSEFPTKLITYLLLINPLTTDY